VKEKKRVWRGDCGKELNTIRATSDAGERDNCRYYFENGAWAARNTIAQVTEKKKKRNECFEIMVHARTNDLRDRTGEMCFDFISYFT